MFELIYSIVVFIIKFALLLFKGEPEKTRKKRDLNHDQYYQYDKYDKPQY